MQRLSLAAALLLSTLSAPSWAQSPAEHQAHHPDQKEAPSANQPASPLAQPGMGGAQGGGMMGSGMMGGGMMNMMGGKMSMMDMMQMMGMMRQSGDGMSGMEMIDHVEGRIAFLRTELKITEAQASAWNAIADALRSNAKTLGELRASMMPQPGTARQSLVDRLELQEKWLAARLEGTRAIKSALINFVGTLSDEQKKTADDLLAPHIGMGMMAGMQAGQMGSGQMQPGMMTQGQGR